MPPFIASMRPRHLLGKVTISAETAQTIAESAASVTTAALETYAATKPQKRRKRRQAPAPPPVIVPADQPRPIPWGPVALGVSVLVAGAILLRKP
jgi:hypothetical protein